MSVVFRLWYSSVSSTAARAPPFLLFALCWSLTVLWVTLWIIFLPSVSISCLMINLFSIILFPSLWAFSSSSHLLSVKVILELHMLIKSDQFWTVRRITSAAIQQESEFGLHIQTLQEENVMRVRMINCCYEESHPHVCMLCLF